MKAEMGINGTVVATGGFGYNLLAVLQDCIDHVEPYALH